MKKSVSPAFPMPRKDRPNVLPLEGEIDLTGHGYFVGRRRQDKTSIVQIILNNGLFLVNRGPPA